MSGLSITYPQQEGLEELGLWKHATATKPAAMEIISSMSENICDEDTSYPENDFFVKVRKPYTITKQRERWTEEEHETFLEALKLYGRAWRRIEEKIGTKTAVQIRSHAQKFFSKLERDQSSGGNFIKSGEDIDIPPPRPKRKPTHPYPRKAPPTAPNIVKSQQSTIAITSPECSLLKDSELLNSAMTSSTSDEHLLKASGGRLAHHRGWMLAEGMKSKVDVEPQAKGTIKLFGQTVLVDAASATCKRAQMASMKSESEIPESAVSINCEVADEIESRKPSSRDESGMKPKLATRSASRGSNLSTLESSISMSRSSMDQNEESRRSKTLHRSASKYNLDTRACGHMNNEESAQRSKCGAYQLDSFTTQAQSHRCSAAYLQDAGALSYGGCLGAAPDVVASVGEQIHPLAVPLQLWQTMGHQNSAAGLASHAAYWPMLISNPATVTPISALPTLNSSDSTAASDGQRSVSVTAATIAAASAWWALQGAIPPGMTIMPSMQASAYIASAPNYSPCSSQFAARVLEDHDSEKRMILVNREFNFRSASKDEDGKEHMNILGDNLNQPREKLQMGSIHPSKRIKTMHTTNQLLHCGPPLKNMESLTPARCSVPAAADTAYQRCQPLVMFSQCENENFTNPNSVYSQDNGEGAMASKVLKKLSTSGSNSCLLQQYSDTCAGKSVRNLLDLVEGTYDDTPNLSGQVHLSPSDRGGPSSNSSGCGNSRCSATSFPTSDSGSDNEAERGDN